MRRKGIGDSAFRAPERHIPNGDSAFRAPERQVPAPDSPFGTPELQVPTPVQPSATRKKLGSILKFTGRAEGRKDLISKISDDAEEWSEDHLPIFRSSVLPVPHLVTKRAVFHHSGWRETAIPDFLCTEKRRYIEPLSSRKSTFHTSWSLPWAPAKRSPNHLAFGEMVGRPSPYAMGKLIRKMRRQGEVYGK